jgi:hypothetical protein
VEPEQKFQQPAKVSGAARPLSGLSPVVFLQSNEPRKRSRPHVYSREFFCSY